MTVVVKTRKDGGIELWTKSRQFIAVLTREQAIALIQVLQAATR